MGLHFTRAILESLACQNVSPSSQCSLREQSLIESCDQNTAGEKEEHIGDFSFKETIPTKRSTAELQKGVNKIKIKA